MKRVLLSAGHDRKRKGAFNKTYGIYEYEIVEPLAEMVHAIINWGNVIRADIVESERLEDVIRELRGDGVITYAVEFHLNAATASAHGCETLYFASEAKAFAEGINVELVEILGNRNRGVKHRDNLGFLKTGDASAIPEPFFMSNDKELVEYVCDEDGTINTMKLVKLALAHATSIIRGVEES